MSEMDLLSQLKQLGTTENTTIRNKTDEFSPEEEKIISDGDINALKAKYTNERDMEIVNSMIGSETWKAKEDYLQREGEVKYRQSLLDAREGNVDDLLHNLRYAETERDKYKKIYRTLESSRGVGNRDAFQITGEKKGTLLERAMVKGFLEPIARGAVTAGKTYTHTLGMDTAHRVFSDISEIIREDEQLHPDRGLTTWQDVDGLSSLATYVGESAATAIPWLAMGMATSPTTLAATGIVLGHGQMREALERQGIKDEATLAKASYTYGTLIGTLQAAVPWVTMKGMTRPMTEVFAAPIGQISARVASNTLKMGVAQTLAMELAMVAEKKGVSDVTGKPIDWAQVYEESKEVARQSMINGGVFGLVGEGAKIRAGAYKVQKSGETQSPQPAPAPTAEQIAQQELQRQQQRASELATVRTPEADAERAALKQSLDEQRLAQAQAIRDENVNQLGLLDAELATVGGRIDLTPEQRAALEAEINTKRSDILAQIEKTNAEIEAFNVRGDGNPKSGSALKAVRYPYEVDWNERPKLDATEMASVRANLEAEHLADPRSAEQPDPYAEFRQEVRDLPDEVSDKFQVHGIATGDRDQALLDLLNNGIDQERGFNSGPPTPGTNGVDTTRVTAPYLLLSDPGKSLPETGVKNVVLNGPSSGMMNELKRAYPGVNFMTSREAVSFMKGERQTSAPPQPQSKIPPEIRAEFRKALVDKVPRKKWGDTLGVTPEDLKLIIDDALKQGFLRIHNGVARRTSKIYAGQDEKPVELPDTGPVVKTEEAAQKWPEMQAAVDQTLREHLPEPVRAKVQEVINATRSTEDQKYAIGISQRTEGDTNAPIRGTGGETGGIGEIGGAEGRAPTLSRGTGAEDIGTAGARIVRREAATLRKDGTVIVGRRVRGKGSRREGDNIQRVGTTRSRTMFPGYSALIEAVKLHSGNVAEGTIARLDYKFYDNSEGKKKSLSQSDAAVHIEVKQHEDGAWEVDWLRVSPDQRGKKMATMAYDAIEKDLGIRLSPSGMLTDEGLAFWKKRSPESVKWHQKTPDEDGMNYSPRKILDETKRVTKMIDGVKNKTYLSAKDKSDYVRSYNVELKMLRNMWEALPPEAKTPRVTDSMFALRGFYSPAIRAAESISQTKGTGEQFWKQITKGPNVRRDELEWMGIEEFLKGKKSVTKQEVVDFMRAHQIELRGRTFEESEYKASPLIVKHALEYLSDVMESTPERIREDYAYINDQDYVTLAIESGFESPTVGPRYQEYSIPGGSNYKEFILKIPGLGAKYDDVALSSIEKKISDLESSGRSEEDIDAERRALYAEERRILNEGVRTEYVSKHFKDNEVVHVRADDRTGSNSEKILFLNEVQADIHQDARFIGGYGVEAYNKALSDAEAAFEKLSDSGVQHWDTDMRKATDRLAKLRAMKPIPEAPFKGDLWLELALKRMLLQAVEGGYDAISWARSDQIARAVGAEQKKLALQYDQKIGKFLDKYTKKWGGRVEESSGIVSDQPAEKGGWQMGDGEVTFAEPKSEGFGGKNQILRITPEMRASVLEGQPLSAKGQEASILGQAKPDEMLILIAARAVENEARGTGRSPIAEAIRTARHEVLEMAKALGLISEKEWSTLTKAARKQGWVESQKVRDAYEEAYADAVKSGRMTKAQLEELLVKEAIFERFADFEAGNKNYPKGIAGTFQRIIDFFKGLGRNIRKVGGFENENDIFLRYREGGLKKPFSEAFPEFARTANADQLLSMKMQPQSEPKKSRADFDEEFRKAAAEYERAEMILEDARMTINKTGNEFIDRRKIQMAEAAVEAAREKYFSIEDEFNKAYPKEAGDEKPDLHLSARAAKPPSPVEEAAELIRSELGLQMPAAPWKGKKTITERQQVVAIATAGGERILDNYANEMSGFLNEHMRDIAGMALPGSEAPVREGFSALFREYILRPDRLKQTHPQLHEAMLDTIDAELPQLLEAIDRLHEAGRERIAKERAKPIIVPKPPVRKPAKDMAKAAFRKAFDAYVRNIQPDAASDAALVADALTARMKAASAQEKDALFAAEDKIFMQWLKQPVEVRLQYLRDMELGAEHPTIELAEMAYRDRQKLEYAHLLEKQWGSKAGYLEDYFPHIWKKPDEARKMIAALGPEWFQKARDIDMIEAGRNSGLELVSTNPSELLTMRLLSGVDMRKRVELLHDFRKIGLATDISSLSEISKMQMMNAGWEAVRAPNMDQWLVSPDAMPVWNNGVAARGLWQAEGMLGSTFRGWMAIKNAWVPLKLAFSGFHVLHVAHINLSNNLARAWTQASHGDFADAFVSAISSLDARQGRGFDARMAWHKPRNERTEIENYYVDLMTDGGFVPQLSEQLRINARRQLAVAISEADYLKAAPAAFRRGIERMQYRVFENWIPGVKAAAYIKEAEALLQRKPWLVDDQTARIVALRSIAKSVDNRFGEMFYGNLFWNRYLKDAGIASFLSLGWNLGFTREFIGAPLKALAFPYRLLQPPRPLSDSGRLAPPPKPIDMKEGKDGVYYMPEQNLRRLAAEANNKIANSLIYISTAALFTGTMMYALSGEKPKEVRDYIFPKTGYKNADGTDHRLNSMFFNREWFMLKKHIEEENSVIGGIGAMMYNKMLFQPFVEMARNKDYWGYEIYDADAPYIKKAGQFMKHIFQDQLAPMTFSSAARAAKVDDTWTPKGIALAFAGFSPAPSYVNRTRMENRIRHYYQNYVAPMKKPYAQEEIDTAKREAKDELKLALMRGDREAAAVARKKARDAGASAETLTSSRLKQQAPTYLFSRLNEIHQERLLEEASPAERNLYRRYAKEKVRKKFPVAPVE